MLWQHLFWFFGHPEVYVVLLPALGIVAEIMTTFARKKLFGYKTILYTTFATGGLAFVVWAHHQFMLGLTHGWRNLPCHDPADFNSYRRNFIQLYSYALWRVN